MSQSTLPSSLQVNFIVIEFQKKSEEQVQSVETLNLKIFLFFKFLTTVTLSFLMLYIIKFFVVFYILFYYFMKQILCKIKQ